MENRIYNFSAGPAVLPVPVLQTVKENIISYQGSGMGIMELSHRGAHFEEIIATAEKNIRELLNIGDDHSVIFTTGGATQQFSMIPMNLLGDKKTADFVITGSWSKLAMKEAQKFGSTHVAASSEDKNFNYIPTSVNLSDDPAYLHFTSNNTIFGTQFKEEPKAGKVPLVCDASSDIFHKKIDINKYALVYAGAQKNLGPAGVTLVIIRKDLKLFEDAKRPVLLDYNTYVSSSSLYNTPPTLPIYVVGEVLKWIRAQGGLDKIYQQNLNKAKIVYDQIDSNLEFFEAVAEQNSRSLMNITFRLKNKDLEGKFIKEAESQGLNGLKGHRSVGGMRASIYNAFPAEGATALATFMKEFAQKNG